MDSYQDGDLVAQWNPETQGAEYVMPQQYLVLPAETMLRIRNAHSVDMVLSPEHRVVFYDWKGALRVETAEYIAEKIGKRSEGPRFHVPVTFYGTGSGIGLSAAQIRLMVAVHADGHFPDFYRERNIPKCFMTLRKDRKKDRLRKLLRQCEIAHNERVYPGRPTETVFEFIAPVLSKHYAGWWSANLDQLGIIYDEFQHWDGLKHNDGEVRFTSIHKEDADFIQYVCAATGHRATISYKDHAGWSRCYTVHATRKLHERCTFRNATVERIESSDGNKYCFVVDTGYFIARHNDRIFITGNSGKSVGCCLEIINVALHQRPDKHGRRRTRWAVIRNSYPELKSTTIKTWQDWFPATICPIRWDAPITGRMQRAMPDGTVLDLEVIFLALDQEKDIKKLLSLELTGAWINEAREVQKSIVDAVTSRVGRFPPKKDFDLDKADENPITWSGVIADTNPPDEDHWWYQAAELGGLRAKNGRLVPVKGWKFFHQPGALLEREGGGYEPNPQAENVKHQPLGYDYWIRQLAGKSKEWIKVYVLGQYGTVMTGKPIYEADWSDPLHVTDVGPAKGFDLVIGLDFGLTPAAVIGQYVDGIRVFDEVIGDNIGFRRFATDHLMPLLNTKYRGYHCTFVGDPAGAKRADHDERSVFMEALNMGIEIQPAPSNSIQARLEAVRFYMTQLRGGKPAFQLNRKCNVLRKGFNGGYRYAKIQVSGSERYRDTPEKNEYSHPHDALQYLCLYLREGGLATPVSNIGYHSYILDRTVGY